MKRIITISILLTALAFDTEAQVVNQPGSQSFGIYFRYSWAGMAYADITGDENCPKTDDGTPIDVEPEPGIQRKHYFSRLFSFSYTRMKDNGIEDVYSIGQSRFVTSSTIPNPNLSAEHSNPDDFEEYNFKYSATYTDILVGRRAGGVSTKNVNIYAIIYGGVSIFSHATNEVSYTLNSGEEVNYTNDDFELTDLDYKKVILNAGIGMGTTIPINKRFAFTAEARFHLLFGNIHKRGTGPTYLLPFSADFASGISYYF